MEPCEADAEATTRGDAGASSAEAQVPPPGIGGDRREERPTEPAPGRLGMEGHGLDRLTQMVARSLAKRQDTLTVGMPSTLGLIQATTSR
jgi:hypothetical protein